MTRHFKNCLSVHVLLFFTLYIRSSNLKYQLLNALLVLKHISYEGVSKL